MKKNNSQDKIYFSIPYENCFKNAALTGIPADLREFPESDSEALATYRISRFFYYWKRFIALMLERSPADPACYAIIDKEGEMADVAGCAQTIRQLEECGIRKSMIWDMEHVGPNAISYGLNEKQSYMTSGETNYNLALRQFAVYFVPAMVRHEARPQFIDDLGGLAILVPLKYQSGHYMIILNTVVHDLLLNIQFSQITNNIFTDSHDGVLSLDNLTYATPSILFCNSNCYDIFGIKGENLRFHSLIEMIDPLPANEKLWDIILNIRRVNDQHISISSRGHEYQCILSSIPFNQAETLKIKGIVLFITTSRRVSATVSEKMGNNAIMSFDTMIGSHPKMQSAIRKGILLANAASNIMLIGESGVGKDVFAQAIHNESSRRSKPFIAINCGALPRDLIASELFGYDAGAFTGAKKNGNIGKFELANGGTIFLDEIGELPIELQATLLRIVEQKKFMRLGSNKDIELDVKIICATNVDIPTMIQQKRFRADLYYRLSTLLLEIPPLRERGDDILRLAGMTMERLCRNMGKVMPAFSRESQNLMMHLYWPGNVRELQNTMERIIQLYDVKVILPEHILDCIDPSSLAKSSINLEDYRTSSGADLPEAEKFTVSYTMPSDAMAHAAAESGTEVPAPAVHNGHKRGQLTREDIENALQACRGSRTEAAQYLGIARKTLYRNMEKLGL